MQRLISLILIAIVFIFFSACNDEDGIPMFSDKLHIGLYNHGSHDKFAEYPIRMFPQPSVVVPDNAKSYQWSFGDGNESTEKTPVHTYTAPGTYTIRLTVGDGRKYYTDSTIIIHPKPIILGDKNLSERGKFIAQDKDLRYKILFRDAEWDHESEWKLATLGPDKNFSEITLLTLGARTDYFPVIVNRQGNIVGWNGRFLEIDSNGTALANESAFSDGFQLIENENGYCFLAENGFNIILVQVDAEGNETSSQSLNITKDGYKMTAAYFKTTDRVSIHYIEEVGGEVTQSTVCERLLSGEIVYEKKYPSSGNSKAFNTRDGYLYVSTTPSNGTGFVSYRYIKVNAAGDIEWTVYSPWSVAEVDAQYNLMQVFDIDGSIYLFYDHMYGLRIDSNGKIAWQKRFTFLDDQLNAVVYNNEGNFLMMGTHQYDYNGNSRLEDEPTDLIFLEIGKDGQIVD